MLSLDSTRKRQERSPYSYKAAAAMAATNRIAAARDAHNRRLAVFFGKRTAAGGDTLLPAQEGRFLVYIQVDQTRVVELLARRLSAGWVQLLLQDGAAGLPRHQFRSVVAKESLSFFNIASFLELR